MKESEAYNRRELLNEIWESLHPGSIAFLNTNFIEIAPKLLEFLMLSVFNEETIDVGFVEGQSTFAVVPYDQYNYDRQLLLKLLNTKEFELELSLRDYEDEDASYKYKLTQADLESIPKGLEMSCKRYLKLKNPIKSVPTISISLNHQMITAEVEIIPFKLSSQPIGYKKLQPGHFVWAKPDTQYERIQPDEKGYVSDKLFKSLSVCRQTNLDFC